MDELDLEDFRHGGANVTGFRLLRSESPTTREAERGWLKLNPRFGVGAGLGKKIPVCMTSYYAMISIQKKLIRGSWWLIGRFVAFVRKVVGSNPALTTT